jgi:hypothetical protein
MHRDANTNLIISDAECSRQFRLIPAGHISSLLNPLSGNPAGLLERLAGSTEITDFQKSVVRDVFNLKRKEGHCNLRSLVLFSLKSMDY